jgi:pyridoxamine 5'-phosphate oxidase
MTHINSTLQNLRVSYQLSALDINDCDEDPFKQFQFWFDQAIKSECDEPNAFVLSSISAKGMPRARVVLLKGIQNNRFVFYTNYQSSKGKELELNRNVSMTFLWLPLQRQVRIEGVVSKVEPSESDAYFQMRPRGSQLGAIASPQSQKVTSRKDLEEMFAKVEEKYRDTAQLDRPENWGGYGITPNYLEFWQGRPNRMHDRIVYDLVNSTWDKYRLAP